jgi:hypothetical protein
VWGSGGGGGAGELAGVVICWSEVRLSVATVVYPACSAAAIPASSIALIV